MQKTKQAQLQQILIDFYRNPVARVSLELIFSIVAILFFAIFAIRPTLRTMSELIKEIDDKRILDEQLAQKIASLSTAQNQYELFSKDFYLLDEALPKTANLTKSLAIVEKLASDNNLVIQGISVSAVPSELKLASAGQATRNTLTFNVDVTGEYVDMRQLIEDLMSSRRMMVVDQVNFSLGTSRLQHNLRAVIRVNLPYYQSAQQETAVQESKQ